MASLNKNIEDLLRRKSERFKPTDFSHRYASITGSMMDGKRKQQALEKLYDDMDIYDKQHSQGKLSIFKHFMVKGKPAYTGPDRRLQNGNYREFQEKFEKHVVGHDGKTPAFWTKPFRKDDVYVPPELKNVVLSGENQIYLGNDMPNRYYDIFHVLMKEANTYTSKELEDLPYAEKEKMINSMIALSEKNKGGTRRLRRKRRKSRRR
jgi:hypothetical protein